MSVKLRPITPADKSRMTPHASVSRITSSPSNGLDKAMSLPNNVVSSTAFGKVIHNVDDAEDKIFEDKYTRVGYIDLVKPVLNQFLAGRAAPIWRRVLRMSQDEIMSIINVNTIYDREAGGLIPLSSIGTKPFDPERFIYGAELLLYLLDEVDIAQVLEQTLVKKFFLPFMDREQQAAYKDGLFNYGQIYEMSNDELAEALQGERQGWFYANYAINLDNSDFVPAQREFIYEHLGDSMFENYDGTLSQFSNVDILIMLKRDGLDALKKQVMNYVFVLPYGYRPTIDNRVDALTVQYNKLVNANNELQGILDRREPTIYTVMNKYREVVQYVRNIFIGDDYVIHAQRLMDYKSISDTISGKKGLMRDRMQGARIDYSGRAVIISDPEMPIDTIGVPKSMLAKIMEPAIIRDMRKKHKKFAYKNMTRFSSSNKVDEDGFTYMQYMEEYFKSEDRYGAVGRQPTLFYLGIQAFKIRPVDGDAIVLSPLVVEPFNADHDGDTMHFEAAVTEAGQKELRENMFFKNNMHYPKNGAITPVVRHEIFYGLWVCKARSMEPGGVEYSPEALKKLTEDLLPEGGYGFMHATYEALCNHRIRVYDIITTPKGPKPAGVVALEYCVYRSSLPSNPAPKDDFSSPDFVVNAKDITKRALKYAGTNSAIFLSSVNMFVRLGFAVAKLWPPNISILSDSDINVVIKNLVDEFNRDIIEREEFVNIGVETEEEFSAYFAEKYKALERTIKGYKSKDKYTKKETLVPGIIHTHLSPDNGYRLMVESGAKGNDGNTMQIFGIKGRVQKDDISSFNSIVAGCYSEQLTGMDHLITAYGSRKGISDKVLATAEPGYLSRKLEHAGSIITINADDCGTDAGLEFELSDIVPFLDESNISKYGIYPAVGSNPVEVETFWNRMETNMQFGAATDYLSKLLVGRYVIEDSGESVYIQDEAQAKHHIKGQWYKKSHGVVSMRSPIYCKCPCCQKCYGYHTADDTLVAPIGTGVGFIAAQAIGEPGTQMTMKNFQKGGVVTEANLTSQFELIEDYFELHNFANKRRNKRGIINYDRISPVSGYIKEQYLGNGGKRIIVTETDDENDFKNLIPGTTKIVVDENVKLKSYVHTGESFQAIQGDLNMKEVFKHRGYDKAASYLALKLHNIFLDQDVAFKHFECMVTAMTVFVLLTETQDNGYSKYGAGSVYHAGSVLTLPEFFFSNSGAAGIKTLLGLKNLPKFKSDFFESILMENMDSYVPRAILMNPNDSMSNPITRAAFGLKIGIGTDMQ